jgi:hypothetical protein
VTTDDPEGWRHLFGSQRIPDPGPGAIEITLDAYGYAWFGARTRA